MKGQLAGVLPKKKSEIAKKKKTSFITANTLFFQIFWV